MQQRRSLVSSLIIVICLLAAVVLAVDRSKFRTCQDTRFCRTYRNAAAPTTENQWFRLNRESIKELNGKVVAEVLTTKDPLQLELSFLSSGNLRVKINEKKGNPRWQPTELLMPQGLAETKFSKAEAKDLPPSWRSKDPSLFSAFVFKAEARKGYHTWGGLSDQSDAFTLVVLQHSPLRLEVFRRGGEGGSGDQPLIVMNDRNLMHFEQRSSEGKAASNANQAAHGLSHEDRHKGKDVIDYGEDGLAIYADGTREEKATITTPSDETSSQVEVFQGHSDSVPHGPMSVGVDFSFPCSSHLYGLPEHTTPLSLPTTTGSSSKYSQPYRLYNLDVFEYELDETMALYGNIPFLFGHGSCPGSTNPTSAGLFWFNPSESFIDISEGGGGGGLFGGGAAHYKESHWMSESGLIDVFLFTGPSPRDLSHQFATLVGTQQLPPLFSLGYHQCRWNYRDERDVAQVNSQFEALDYPYDVLWLDIEHTNGKRYFTWDDQLFPHPLEMQKNISSLGRKMVTIIDPHIKRDDNYHIHKEATEKGLYIKDKTGEKDFDGWCWPGSSSYLDFTSSRVREWWAGQFALDKYQGSTLDLFTWNDMNEPSVFNGPEVSMSKDSLSTSGVEHREWHNLYGLYMAQATGQGQLLRSGGRARPFVLTRAFWAGSQRFGAMWTGDNKAEWAHLQGSAAMVLAINLAGFSFSGADTGGFFGDTSAELFTRWYQAGAFTPFFRGHAHHDTKRKEPWVYGEPHTSLHRAVALLRYSLLPYWYSVFFEGYSLGLPVMRPLFYEFPAQSDLFNIDDQWLIGSALMVKPVVQQGAKTINVVLPKIKDSCEGADKGATLPWYDFHSLRAVAAPANGVITLPVDLSSIPLFLRPGSILPRKMRLRRSSSLMFYDPITLTIAPGSCGRAEGFLYLDDEVTVDHEDEKKGGGAFVMRSFLFTGSELKASRGLAEGFFSINKGKHLSGGSSSFSPSNTLERVVIAGQSQGPPKKVLLVKSSGEEELSFSFDGESQVLTIKKPAVKIVEDWTISLQY